MLITIDNILDEARLQTIHKLLDKAHFVDGKLSAGMAAKRVKNNEEVAQHQVGQKQTTHAVAQAKRAMSGLCSGLQG